MGMGMGTFSASRRWATVVGFLAISTGYQSMIGLLEG
jgi:hypothetical protein